MNRRKLFKLAAGASGFLLTKNGNAEEVCNMPVVPTTEQTEGPFYPSDWTEYEADADMLSVDGGGFASGQVTILRGRVFDMDCRPIVGAEVDVWQANIFGQYFHENDTVFEDLKDQNFQYRCRVKSGIKGDFSIRTIKPAAYPVGTSDWVRPPHIHYKVKASGFEELTTQMYFNGDSLNGVDRILNGMTEDQRKTVIVDFKEDQNKVLTGSFDIFLKKT